MILLDSNKKLCVGTETHVDVHAKLCGQQLTSFGCRIVLSIANQFSLPNCMVCSEPFFAVELCG
jgi:hypothetical protein